MLIRFSPIFTPFFSFDSQGQSSKHGRMNPSMKSEGYGDKVIQQLNNLRSRNELCDFKVSAGEKSFQVVS